MIPEEIPSRHVNYYEAPIAAVDAQTGEDRLSEDDRPRYQGTVIFLRIMGGLHLVFGLGALTTPAVYLKTLLLVLRGTNTAPWLLSPVWVVSALYFTAISALSFAAAYGLFRQKRWTRGVVLAFLVVYFSLITMGCIIQASRGPMSEVIAGLACYVTIVIPTLVLALSSKCALVLSGLQGSPPETAN